MSRANRYHVPGYIWHVTHRCHKKEFLLKFSIDRRKWMAWLFQAKRRYGLKILNYIITCNHIHLLLLDAEDPRAIPRSLQLAAGRTAQEFNIRKARHGAFWEDRYHATAIETGVHLKNCLSYIDLNMVRAGRVMHPVEWVHSGFHEMERAPRRRDLVDYESLLRVFGIGTLAELRILRRGWAEEKMAAQEITREPCWTESVAIGSREFLNEIKRREGIRIRQRAVAAIENSDSYQLREAKRKYCLFGDKKVDLRPKIGSKTP